MLHVLLYWMANTFQPHGVIPSVKVVYSDIEAIYVPPDYSGPIVAIPTDEIFLTQEVKNADYP